jgi:hypothetical protein
VYGGSILKFVFKTNGSSCHIQETAQKKETAADRDVAIAPDELGELEAGRFKAKERERQKMALKSSTMTLPSSEDGNISNFYLNFFFFRRMLMRNYLPLNFLNLQNVLVTIEKSALFYYS